MVGEGLRSKPLLAVWSPVLQAFLLGWGWGSIGLISMKLSSGSDGVGCTSWAVGAASFHGGDLLGQRFDFFLFFRCQCQVKV